MQVVVTCARKMFIWKGKDSSHEYWSRLKRLSMRPTCVFARCMCKEVQMHMLQRGSLLQVWCRRSRYWWTGWMPTSGCGCAQHHECLPMQTSTPELCVMCTC